MARATVRIEDGTVIPAEVGELEAFRRWVRSPDFPERGRIDYLGGTIEVDMSPEELQSHGVLKTRLVLWIGQIVEEQDLGQVFVDRARLSSSDAGLSCEPDVLFVSWQALQDGRVRYRPANEGSQRLIEVVGSATLAVEVVSDSSVGKDTQRLPPLYARAGVEELWIADARGPDLRLQVHHLEDGRYVPAPVDAEGFQKSRVLNRRLRLRRQPGLVAGTWRYLVDEPAV